MFSLVILIFNLFLCVLSFYCGPKSCPSTNTDQINVHLVPHSHDDVGWLKTVNQYYYGSQNQIQKASVKNILDSVTDELMKDSKRKFIWVETAFLFKWYDQQSPQMQKNLQSLIQNGQLEIVGGAWSMNDEACVNYLSILDQFTLGIRKLTKTFGNCARPRIGWQIDPFGHSREQASIFAQMGYDGQFIARIDWVEKVKRFKNLEAELIWQTSENLDSKTSNLFTGLLYNHYSSPPGFCFDILCNDDPIIDANNEENNVATKVQEFLQYIENLTKVYRSKNILIPMGDDFNYQNARTNFENMDKLIKYINERSNSTKINIFYSTPFCYLKSLHNSQSTWPTKTQDFFPYSTDWHSYWSGYYSSRPTQKRFERDANHFLQVTKQLTTLAKLPDFDLNALRETMGVMQHHDAISGTEKQHVCNDYNRKLYESISNAYNITRDSLRNLTNLSSAEFESCFNLNISVCFISSQETEFTVTMFNPLSHSSTQYVRIPVQGMDFVVKNSSGQILPSQVIKVPDSIVSLPFRSNKTNYEIVFRAHVIKLASFHIMKEVVPRFPKDFFLSQLKQFNFRMTLQKYLTKLPSVRKLAKNSSSFLDKETGKIKVANVSASEIEMDESNPKTVELYEHSPEKLTTEKNIKAPQNTTKLEPYKTVYQTRSPRKPKADDLNPQIETEGRKLFTIDKRLKTTPRQKTTQRSRHSWQRRQRIEYSPELSPKNSPSFKYPTSGERKKRSTTLNETHFDSFKMFEMKFFEQTNDQEEIFDVKLMNEEVEMNNIIQNKHIKLEFTKFGQLLYVEMNKIRERTQQEFCYYQSAAGNNLEFKNRSSGAYIFRPANNGKTICFNKPRSVSFIEGLLVKEVHQVFNDWISQVIRIYEDARRIEFEWLIGPIPIDDGIGKEIITRFNTSIYNDDIFYTDSNGREMIKRIRNQREYFEPNMTEWVSGNYYPITSRIAIQQNDKRLAIFIDRAQGGSSIFNGSIELMLHRRLLNDDAFGVGEALNETQYGDGLVARGKYYVLLGSINQKISILERLTQLELLLPFWKFFSSLQCAGKCRNHVKIKPNFSKLPLDVNVLTYEQWSDSEILIRFENYLDKTETSQTEFNIRSIFDEIGGIEMTETTLDGSLALEKMQKMDFNSDGNSLNKPKYISVTEALKCTKEDEEDKFDITLKPMQIRTFVIKYEK